jgi:flagellar motor switch protein FliN
MTNNISTGMALDELGEAAPVGTSLADSVAGGENVLRSAVDLEAVFDVPVRVQAVLGKSIMEVRQLLKLAPGAVIELDRRVGEAIDIYVNNRLVARGEVVLVDEHLGVTMTEIVKQDRAA